MMRVLSACTLTAWLLCACDVATVAQVSSNVAQNQCTGDSECPGGSCVDGQCESHQGTFQTLLFEVTPPSGTSASADLQFLTTVTNMPTAGGDWDLPLDAVSQVVGDVKPDPPRTCKPTFGDVGNMLATSGNTSLPGTISLTPSQTELGVFSQSAVAQATLPDMKNFSFAMNVPPGEYDIYYQPPPERQSNEDCIVSPQLRRKQMIYPGAPELLALGVPASSSFVLTVKWPPGDGGLDGWTVDMIDPVSGRVISNPAQLALPPSGDPKQYLATVHYLPVVGDTSDQTAQELLRLSPPAFLPDGVTVPTMPTILLSRSALGLFDANSGTLSDFTALPAKVTIHGQVTALHTPKPVAATVTLVATKITGIYAGVLASFVRTVTVGADGQFDLDVLPGSYRVTAVPTAQLDAEATGSADSKLAAVSTDWTIADSPPDQSGKVIELSTALPISGEVFDASGATPVVTALVQAVASTTSTNVDVLHQALGEAVIVPRAATARVESDGAFALIADPGTFDVSVRPLAESGFSWLVVPGVAVSTTGAGASLMSRALPLPVVYRGTVTLPGAAGAPNTAVPGALIRAFVYTSAGQYTSEPAKADAVVQVAETRADTSGAFKLLIPATLNGAVH
ncbi:MAG TPA: hypothetical protein VIK01_06065 [Polyangiaceae bacterium]